MLFRIYYIPYYISRSIHRSNKDLLSASNLYACTEKQNVLTHLEKPIKISVFFLLHFWVRCACPRSLFMESDWVWSRGRGLPFKRAELCILCFCREKNKQNEGLRDFCWVCRSRLFARTNRAPVLILLLLLPLSGDEDELQSCLPHTLFFSFSHKCHSFWYQAQQVINDQN